MSILGLEIAVKNVVVVGVTGLMTRNQVPLSKAAPAIFSLLGQQLASEPRAGVNSPRKLGADATSTAADNLSSEDFLTDLYVAAAQATGSVVNADWSRVGCGVEMWVG